MKLVEGTIGSRLNENFNPFTNPIIEDRLGYWLMLHLYVEYLDNGVHRQIVVRADLRGDKRRISQFDYNWGLIEAYDPKVTLWQKIWKRFRIG